MADAVKRWTDGCGLDVVLDLLGSGTATLGHDRLDPLTGSDYRGGEKFMRLRASGPPRRSIRTTFAQGVHSDYTSASRIACIGRGFAAYEL